MRELTKADLATLALWDEYPAGTVLSATQIGESLWGGDRSRQCYARPGGKAGWSLVRKGYAARATRDKRTDGFVRTRTPAP